MDTTPQRDTEFYFDTITFLVDNTIFKVPSKYIHEKSEIFGAGAQISSESGEGSSDANPVKLSPLPHGCTADDFKQLLKIIFLLTVNSPTPTNYTLEQWLSVLKLSTAWFFSDIRKLAMEQVSGSPSDYDRPTRCIRWSPSDDTTRDQWITVLDFAHTSSLFADLRDLAVTRVSRFRFSSSVDQVLLGRKYLHKPWVIQGLRELVNDSTDLPSLAELRRLGQETLIMLLYRRAQDERNNDRDIEEYFYDEIASIFPHTERPSSPISNGVYRKDGRRRYKV